MTNLEKYMNVFVNSFGVKIEEVKTLKYQNIKAWDSVGHMGLVAKIEEVFDIMLETEDIIDLNSFEKGKEILSDKYGVDFSK